MNRRLITVCDHLHGNSCRRAVGLHVHRPKQGYGFSYVVSRCFDLKGSAKVNATIETLEAFVLNVVRA